MVACTEYSVLAAIILSLELLSPPSFRTPPLVGLGAKGEEGRAVRQTALSKKLVSCLQDKLHVCTNGTDSIT